MKETIGHRQGREERTAGEGAGLGSSLLCGKKGSGDLRKTAARVTDEGGQEGQCVLMQKQVGVRCCVGKRDRESQDEGLELSGLGLKKLCYEIGVTSSGTIS